MLLPDCSVDGIRVVELQGRDEARLQRFFEQAPEYFIAVNGEPATPTEAREELLVDSRLRGTGLAHRLHSGLEAWAAVNGAQWLQLGYVQVRTREGITMGRQVNRVSIQLKALAGGQVEDYLALVARDRPGTL